MKSRSFIIILVVLFCLTNVIASCGKSSDNEKKARAKIKSINNHQVDTSTTAIISFDPKGNYLFDTTNKPAKLTEDDINKIDSLLIECVVNYNNSVNKEHKNWGIDLVKRNYKKQLIAVTNKNGEKEVWVNCFCNTWNSNDWKTGIMIVSDGGNCYFNFKINLTTKKYYSLLVNGRA